MDDALQCPPLLVPVFSQLLLAGLGCCLQVHDTGQQAHIGNHILEHDAHLHCCHLCDSRSQRCHSATHFCIAPFRYLQSRDRLLLPLSLSTILSHLYACCKTPCICQQFLLHSQHSLVSISSRYILHSVGTCSLSVGQTPVATAL